MTNQALIYHRPSKWPITTALGAAVLIHLSAVAIAFHREPIAQSTASDSIIFPVDGEYTEPIPLDPDISVALPEPVPAADFIEPQETRRPTNRNQNSTPIRRQGQNRISTIGNGKAFAVSAPRPDYPYEARSRHLTGSGVAIVTVDPVTGSALDVTMAQSIGNPILDNSTISALRSWRFKPGSPSRVRIPITFLLTGAQY
jgi:TonB family protein